MKTSAWIMLILFVSSGGLYYIWTSERTEFYVVNVTRIIDGDTVEISEGKKIRLIGINTPERGQIYYDAATEFLEVSVLNKNVSFESYGSDKYDRELGYLFLHKRNINLEILRNGLGSLYYYERDSYYKEMEKTEGYARENGLGIWRVSENEYCVELVELGYTEPERLVLENICDFEIEVMIKDDATHIYEEVLKPGIFEMETSHIWNDAGDSLYVYDNEGLVEFYRY